MKYEYYKLLDLANENRVVRTTGSAQQTYETGEGWVDTGILTRYFCDESDYYDLYEEITEVEALALVEGVTE